jgi:autotransporter translocation and assembly factor TamB
MVRRLVHVLVIVLTLVVGAAAAAIIVSQTAWFKNWLRGYIIEQSANYLNGQLRIERLGGNLFFGVEMENVGISMDGTEVVAVSDLGLDYNVFELISSGMSIDDIRLNQPRIYLRREGDSWSITRLIKKQAQEADREGPARPIAIDNIEVTDGTLVLEQPVGTSGVDIPDRIEQFDADLAFKYEPVRYTIEVTEVSFRGAEPAIGLNELSGHVSVENDTLYVESLAVRTEESALAVDGTVRQYLTTPIFELQVSSEKVSLPEIARVVPALAGVPLQPAFEVKVNGPMDRLGVDMNVRSSAGALTGQLTADVLDPGMSVVGDIKVRNLNLAPILKDPAQQTDLTATASVDLEAADFARTDTIHGTVTVDAPRVVAAGYTAENIIADARIARGRVALNGRASAYGARATARGTVTLPAQGRALAYDLRGEARQLNLSRLPRGLNVPRAQTNVNAAYHIVGTGGAAALRAEARFADSTVAGARIVDGSTVDVTMRGRDLAYQADVRVAGADLQRLGREFNVPALADRRYQSDLNAHVVASGRGRDPRTMTVTAHGTVSDSTIAGGRIPHLTFDATIENDAAQVKATGSVADFDPSQLAARQSLQGTVTGNFDVQATIAGLSSGVTADRVAASGRAHLEPSTVGGLQITSADVDADYQDRSADIRRLDVVGRDVNVSASGTLALNETGQSNLTVHADSPSLAEIGKLVDRPLDGMAKVDATITGNRSALQAKGTLVGSGIKYGNNGALTLSSTFEARVPDLEFARAAVDAKTDGTFVTVGGQNINELTATTRYADKQLDFDATARQPERTLAAAGGLTLHPEHSEVHLNRLALDTRGQQWQLAAGSDTTVRYGGGATAVDNLTLVNGAQQITADGTFGRPGDALKVTLTDVDLAAVDALLLRPPQLAGTLNASATVTGTTDAPRADGTFEVRQGAFRQFKYESLTGTVDYEPSGVNVDARLQQDPTQWITAKGFLPSALFSRANPAAATSRIDFALDSSPMDLGVIQGFTDAVTDVTGTFEAHIRVAGTAADPQPAGRITLSQGAVTVAPTGVPYTNIDGQIDLQPDRVHIDAITVLDNHFNPLSLSGDLAIGQRRLQAMQLYVNAEDFEVIDNELGEVRIQSAVEISGSLAAPHVGGYLGVTTGNINLDEIIALAGPSPYPTEPIEYRTSVDAGARPAGSGGPLDALTMDVQLMVPDDLVVQAASLQAPGAPLSLGALNVTLGGDLRATKQAGGRFRLVGVVNTVRGNYDFQGRRFEILRDGTVRFVGLEELNPILDLRTRRLIQGVEARVNVRGSLRKPEIVLSSTPPLEQADILSLIVFNQPVNQLGEGQQISLAQRAQGLAVGAVAGQLAHSIGQALELDTFEIKVAPESGNAAQLTVGEQLGQNLFLKVEQGVGEEATTNFVLEYELTDWLRLQSNVRQGSAIQPSLFRRVQGSGADLIFFFSY